MRNNVTLFGKLAVSLPALCCVSLYAQQVPDAGQLLIQGQPQVSIPTTSGRAIEAQIPQAAQNMPGGPEVEIVSIKFSGNTAISEVELLAELGDYSGKRYDLSGLQDLANMISVYYRSRGYLFARAYVPAQEFQNSTLRIDVIEGRFGSVGVLADDTSIVTKANPFLSDLRSGDVIIGKALERSTLILDDLPGIQIAPVLRPGKEFGQGDLDVRVEITSGVSGDVGYDNHGNRYTGEHRVRANVQWDSPFGFGDQMTFRSLYSSEDMWMGSLGYSLPLGSSGLRANVGYTHTYYELGQDFSSLGASGKARVSSVGVTYPLVRSQRKNVTIAPTLQYKNLNDEQNAAATDDRKSSNGIQLAMNFDWRDTVGGGAVTYGSWMLTSGRIRLDAGLQATDAASGQNTRGHFNKLNFDMARVQATSVAGLVVFGRVSAQWANKNLDSSEGFTAGGPSGVRAYPVGEANGDEGVLTQIELRYTTENYTPFIFYDSARVQINTKTSDLVVKPESNHRSISGVGFGLRYQRGPWVADASLAWRTHGGRPESDTKDRDPRLWASFGYSF